MSHRRYLQEPGVITCPHCDQDFENWDVIEDMLFLPVLDADGYCRNVEPHFHVDCEHCNKIVVFGCDASEGFMPFVVRGRSEADVRYLQLVEPRDPPAELVPVDESGQSAGFSLTSEGQ